VDKSIFFIIFSRTLYKSTFFLLTIFVTFGNTTLVPSGS